MNFDLNQLDVLASVARLGSMTAAAEELAYTPSAVSQQIRRLETEVGAPVFERHARGVNLTEVGVVIMNRAEAIRGQLRGLRNDLEDLAGARSGTLRLGVFPTFAASILPAVMLRFRELYPGIELKIRSSRVGPPLEQLETRDIDMAVIWDYPWHDSSVEGLAVKPLMVDQSVLLLPRTHRLAARSLVAIEDLAEESWVVRADAHPTREVINRCARANGFQARISVEAYDYPEVQAMIAAGLGITLCPALAAQPLRPDIVARPVETAVPGRRISVAYPSGRNPSPAQVAMTSTMEEVVAALGFQIPEQTP